jgi:hypothetical protein
LFSGIVFFFVFNIFAHHQNAKRTLRSISHYVTISHKVQPLSVFNSKSVVNPVQSVIQIKVVNFVQVVQVVEVEVVVVVAASIIVVVFLASKEQQMK